MSDDYQDLVAAYVESFDSVMPQAQWRRINDCRAEPTTVITKGFFTRRERRYQQWKTLRVNPGQQAAYRSLTDCLDIIKGLNLPPDSPIPAQVDAARRRFCEIIDSALARPTNVMNSWDTVEHRQALRLAAEVRAVVALAERREQVVHSIDSDSLARTAAALKADLDAAREVMLTDPLDRALDQAERQSPPALADRVE